MTLDYEPFVFVSYSRHDQEYVTELIDHLEDRGVNVWIDVETEHGSSWPRAIRDRIDRCVAFVVVMSTASDESEWVKRELVRAEQHSKLVLPLLLEGLPFFELNTTRYEDVSDGRMPTPSFLRRLVHLTGGDTGIQLNTRAQAPVWLDEGRRLLEALDYEAAVAAFDRVLQQDPQSAEAHFGRARSLNGLDRNEEALIAADRSLMIDPDQPTAHYSRANALLDLGRRAEALAAYDRALVLDPEHVAAHHNRGVALHELDRLDEALSEFDWVYEREPDDPTINRERGKLLVQMGQDVEGMALLDRSVALDAGSSITHSDRAVELMRLGRNAEAIEAFRRALKLDPDNALAVERLGELADRSG